MKSIHEWGDSDRTSSQKDTKSPTCSEFGITRKSVWGIMVDIKRFLQVQPSVDPRSIMISYAVDSLR